MARRLAGWQCMTTRFSGFTRRRATWLIMWAGNSLVNLPPSAKPHRSWAAIRGGMRQDDAFSLSDAYIQRVELLTSHSKILNLQYNMLLEFTEQVEKLHRGKHASKLSLDVANYVRHHLSEQISVEKWPGNSSSAARISPPNSSRRPARP